MTTAEACRYGFSILQSGETGEWFIVSHFAMVRLARPIPDSAFHGKKGFPTRKKALLALALRVRAMEAKRARP